ncbi:PadR family transcriptional regulator [Halogeometricum sp. S1BR25-6]|uniref:PadR family transcriptional regulator n=1 Tax=Halogeometricum salsisoli TaxID=2950536 RepID=A0ABU2GHL9_9EURY|nr:MarR family transcriptional regulator [Halogeometricum sp. S1BR25-6]MDS0299679.1 PadR family transcriptional regulator [Halogeometricum sp. S1BR25-6]
MFELTGFQRDVLTVIAGLEKPSGQTVKEEIEKEIDEVNHGRLYPNLDALVENGLVEKGQLDRRTNYYALSETGREALENRRQWENETVPGLTED